MNRPEWAESLLSTDYTQTSIIPQKIISTCILLLIAYYAFPYLAYETTIKRTLYEFAIKLTPSWFIYAMQSLTLRPHTSGGTFIHRRNLSDSKAKSEALQEIYQGSGIPGAVKRARGWSGYDKIVNTSSELSFLGLRNWDNSCFQNSVLQGLASLPEFLRYLQRSLRLCLNSGTESKTHKALSEFLDLLNDGTYRKNAVWPPDVLKSLDTWQQQDAQEYFSRILDAVDKESNNCRKALAKRLHPGLNCLKIPKVAGMTNSNETLQILEKKIKELSPSNPIEGMLAQCLRCQDCGYSEGFIFMTFNCITLNLGLGGGCQIEDLLNSYTEPELIEGVECDGCTKKAKKEAGEESSSSESETSSDKSADAQKRNKAKVRSTKAKQITFGRLPDDLVLHINRSIFDAYGNQQKNFSPVGFPSRLKMLGEWCAPINADVEAVQAIYELRCIVTHSGRHDNGHYVACGRRGKDWYSFNDETVTKITEDSVLDRRNVFMLFYEKVEQGLIIDLPTALQPETLDASSGESTKGTAADSIESPTESHDTEASP